MKIETREHPVDALVILHLKQRWTEDIYLSSRVFLSLSRSVSISYLTYTTCTCLSVKITRFLSYNLDGFDFKLFLMYMFSSGNEQRDENHPVESVYSAY